MNLYKKDYIRLSRLQTKFLTWSATLGLPFYLTGGTALWHFYLNHRYSEDLDFFVNNNKDFTKYLIHIKDELPKQFKTDISKTIVTEEFARFFIEDENTLMKIEYVNDVAYRAGITNVSNMGLIDNVTNILSNKLTAVVGRDEPKDVYDIVSIAGNYSFNWKEIFYHSKEKALINEIDVEQRLFTFPVTGLLNVDWLIKPADIEEFKKQLNTIANDFILGSDNSLGKDKMKIGEAQVLIK